MEDKTPSTTATRPPLPPFTRETAIQKVRLAEDGWNSRDPEKVALAYAIASLMSGTTTRGTGIAPMATKTGSSIRTDSWPSGLRQSTTFPFRNQIANTIGRSGAVPTTIQA